MPDDYIRVLRLIEYEGPREFVESQVERSIHGTRVFNLPNTRNREFIRITGTTLGLFPEIVAEARITPMPDQIRDFNNRIIELTAENKNLRVELMEYDEKIQRLLDEEEKRG